MFIEIKNNIDNHFKSGRLPFLLNSVGSTAPQNCIDRPAGLYAHHILWVTDGEGEFEIGSEKFSLKAGQGVFIKRDVPHKYGDGSFNTTWLTFMGLDGFLDSLNIGDCFLFNVTNQLKDSVNALFLHCNGNSTVVSRSAAGYAAVTEFLDSQFAPAASFAEQLDRYFETVYTENISLQGIADAFKMNKYTLCKKCRELTGVTVTKRLKQIRIAKAKQFLLTTPCSADSISKLCGFESPSYFGKVFLEITGLTPRQYRLKHK